MRNKYFCARVSQAARIGYVPRSAYQGGSVLTEYAITSAVVIGALFFPIPGLGVSVIELVISALNDFQNHSTIMLSMP